MKTEVLMTSGIGFVVLLCLLLWFVRYPLFVYVFTVAILAVASGFYSRELDGLVTEVQLCWLALLVGFLLLPLHRFLQKFRSPQTTKSPT